MKILITGATGNVGLSVLNYLKKLDSNVVVIAGVRNVNKASDKLNDFDVSLVPFDFEEKATFGLALSRIDILFLVRPPQLADVEKYFKPLLEEAVNCFVKHIVFLSVQGVENSKIIPHHKIENLILAQKIGYTFLRTAYFMQNFTTTLRSDLLNKQRIFLPAGRAKFTLIDVKDVGFVAAKVLTDPLSHLNKSYELTNYETLTFTEMADKLSHRLGHKIQFISPNLLNFYISKRKEGVSLMYILVLIMLHYFPRFQKTPKTTDCVEKITGQKPRTFDEFVQANYK
ncbi:MAG: NmrA family NAD(P)-binding protein [Saprospiraceae bacterium]